MPGYVSVYGMASTRDIVPKSSYIQFGVIDQTFDDTPHNYAVGDSVMFNINDAEVVKYGSYQYCLIQDNKIILREISLP